MIRICILGDIGSGKSYISKLFGCPVFNADKEVSRLYKNSKKAYKRLKKALPKHVISFPVNKFQILKAIISNKKNIKKIIKIIHPEVRIKLNNFVKKNKNKKAVILDIPLFLENKLKKKGDILVFVEADKKEINKRLKERPNFNSKIFREFKKIQLSLEFKRKKSHFIIKNNFKSNYIKKNVKNILRKIINND